MITEAKITSCRFLTFLKKYLVIKIDFIIVTNHEPQVILQGIILGPLRCLFNISEYIII